jgi:5-methylcytosine-specific restriction protein A
VREQLYDHGRGTAASRGYDARHRKWRRLILATDPVCRICHIGASTVADHVTPLEDGGDWSLENGQGLCSRCHNRKTVAETAARATNLREGRVKSLQPGLSEPVPGRPLHTREMDSHISEAIGGR